MDIKIIEYSSEYNDQLEKIFADFQDYLVELDPLKRLRRMPGYELTALKETIKEAGDNSGVFFQALDDNKVIGFIVGIVETVSDFNLLNTVPSTMGRITELYVKKEYRGFGIGKKLMDTLEEYFKVHDCDCIKVEVFIPNSKAHGFYSTLGYNDRNVEMIKKI